LAGRAVATAWPRARCELHRHQPHPAGPAMDQDRVTLVHAVAARVCQAVTPVSIRPAACAQSRRGLGTRAAARVTSSVA